MKQRIGIVGAGIVGLAHAWSAAERGFDVTVLEREHRASGASIRNFGMVWPIGQPESTRPISMVARDRWLRLSEEAKIWVNPCGSIHLAHHADEWNVLCEYVEKSPPELREHLRLLSPEECMDLSPGIQPIGFIGGMHSDMELCVHPTQAIRTLPDWLQQRYGVQFQFSTTVVDVQDGKLRTASGKDLGFDRIVVCSGHDFETLFPMHFAKIPIRKCKLQMMRTEPQPHGWKLGPHLASGLTLRHYSSFSVCSHLEELKARVAHESPELDTYGIHVMASQDDQGRVVLGDSHEYGDAIEPFDSKTIDDLILRELQKIIRIPSWAMQSHWSGIYSKYAEDIALELSPLPNVHVCTGLGGSGMSMSFGVAERFWDRLS